MIKAIVLMIILNGLIQALFHALGVDLPMLASLVTVFIIGIFSLVIVNG